MPTRRSYGEGGLSWSASRKRWIASVSVGYGADGKRVVRRASGATKTEAKAKLKELVRSFDEGTLAVGRQVMVADVVLDWLKHGLTDRDPKTINTATILATRHVIPGVGARKLKDLTSAYIDLWLAKEAQDLSTSTLRRLLSILRRSIDRAAAQDQVRRNVTLLCRVPRGRSGRESKSLTLEQAKALLRAAEGSPIHAYVVLSLLTGARTEELRALTWDRLNLEGRPDLDPPIPPTMEVWRSVRKSGDTKTRRSRRTLSLPDRAVDALVGHRARQREERARAVRTWDDTGPVFATAAGNALDAANVRRALRSVCQAAGLDPQAWTPRELRHSFVSLMSAAGVPLEDIARLVGHRGTVVTEAVYRKQLRPLLTEGAEAMNHIFGDLEPPKPAS